MSLNGLASVAHAVLFFRRSKQLPDATNNPHQIIRVMKVMMYTSTKDVSGVAVEGIAEASPQGV
jgi:hypothetical protein